MHTGYGRCWNVDALGSRYVLSSVKFLFTLSVTGTGTGTWTGTGGFHKLTTLTIMPILASEASLCEKKSSDKMLPPVGIEPKPFITSDSKSDTILSTCAAYEILKLLLMHHLIFGLG